MSKDIPVKNIVSVFSLPEAKTEFESPSQNTMIMIVNLSLESFGDFETIPDEVKKLRNKFNGKICTNEKELKKKDDL